MTELREDSLLIGDYKVFQDPNLYCFTSDSVRLSKYAKCKNDSNVLELCAGCGIVSLHKFAENQSKGDNGKGRFFLVELQKELYNLLAKNIDVNNLQEVFTPINDDLINTFDYCQKATFDVVLCNPPYEKNICGLKKQNESEKIARAEVKTTFDDIANIAGNALRFGGVFYFLCKSERIFEISETLAKYNMKIKNVELIKGNNRFRLCLVKAVKGAKHGVEIGVYEDC